MFMIILSTLHIFLSLPFAVAHDDFLSRNRRTIQSIYDLTIYPHFLPILANGSAALPAGLFGPDTTGRISPLGNFTGLEDSIEYFFALPPVPQMASGNAFYKADIVEFSAGCPEVAASVVYLRTGPVDPVSGGLIEGSNVTAIKQVAFWKFDENGTVIKYDAWLPNLSLYNAVLLGVDYTIPAVQNSTRQALCSAIQQRCTGPDQQYDSVEDCNDQLSTKPFGTEDEAWGDNIVCRTIHVILTQTRPDAHCPHVGPNGGEGPDNYKCVDIDYSTEYFADEKLFGEPEGVTFTCPDKGYSY